nr:hypothetical protein CFP56_01643 [Quercus suber]
MRGIHAVEYVVPKSKNAGNTPGGVRFHNEIVSVYSRQTLISATDFIWRWNGNGQNTPRELIEGIADYVRLKAGLSDEVAAVKLVQDSMMRSPLPSKKETPEGPLLSLPSTHRTHQEVTNSILEPDIDQRRANQETIFEVLIMEAVGS